MMNQDGAFSHKKDHLFVGRDCRDHLKVKIGPSILNTDLSQLSDECNKLVRDGADYLHLDVMDGSFVPNITFGAPVVKCVRSRVPGTFFDMHMMVSSPKSWVRDIKDAGGDQYTFHVEASGESVIQLVRDAGMQVGLAIKPMTSVDTILPFIDKVDMILVMTVEPGFGGQSFMSHMMPKVRFLRDRFPFMDIEVDGGVNPQTVVECAKAGANMIVSGTAVTKSSNPPETIAYLRQCCEQHIFHHKKNE